MIQSRTWKFKNLDALLKFIKEVDPHMRSWDADKLTVRISAEEGRTESIDQKLEEYGGEPLTGWEDHF